MKKRLLSLALCLVLVVGLFSGLTVNASAGKIDDIKKAYIKEKLEQIKDEFEIPDLDTEAILNSFMTAATSGDFGENNCLHWNVSITGKLTISGTGAMPNFDFPKGNLAPWWNYDALGVITKIGIKSVDIKDGVTNVGDYALFLLPDATQITLPDSVTRIGRYGIAMCSKLTGMSIPKSVTEIGDFGLAGDGLTAVTLPDGLQSLGRGAFDTCTSLTNITLPAAITAVPGKCFANCTKLLNVKYAGTVTAIGERAFEGCKSLTKAPIPETVTELGASAFTGCTALTDVTLPAGVAAIPDGCFQGCTALKDMKLPGTVTTEPTETTPGVRTFTCAVCSQTKTEVIPATGAHTFVFTKTVAPSCTEAGYDLYTCRDCGASEQRNVKPALGHKWDSGTVTTEPTEKDPGTMTYTCTVCGATKTEVIPATGPHTHVWDEGTVTVAPTETTPGVRTYTCTVCGQTRTEIIPATGSAVCPGGAACPSFRFRDVPAPSNWAHEGIDYCVRHGLMSGFDATTFSPDTVSTRAQIVMILYNLSGDTTDYSKYYVPFTDVMPGTWYYNAVAWGYDKDIVSGMSATTFAPDGLITREQMAVLLYGYTEKYAPAYLGGAASLNGFPDAASVSNWAYAAMSWAVGNGLISGIASNGADYLAPSGGATRAQIAAIMMRYCRLTGL